MQLLALFDAMGLREQMVDQTVLQRKAMERAIRGEEDEASRGGPAVATGTGRSSMRSRDGGRDSQHAEDSESELQDGEDVDGAGVGVGSGNDEIELSSGSRTRTVKPKQEKAKPIKVQGKGKSKHRHGRSQARGRDLVVAHVLERRSKIRTDVRSQLPITLSILANGPGSARGAAAVRASGQLPAVAEASGYSAGFMARLPRGTGHKDLISKVIFVPSTQGVAATAGNRESGGTSSFRSSSSSSSSQTGDTSGRGVATSGTVGRYFSASVDGTICVWDAQSKPGLRLRHGFRVAGAPVRDMIWLPRSQMLAVATPGSIQIFIVNSIVGTVHLHGRISHSLIGHAQPMCLATYVQKGGFGGGESGGIKKSSRGSSSAQRIRGGQSAGEASLVKATADAANARAQADAALRELSADAAVPDRAGSGATVASNTESVSRRSVASLAASAAAQAAAQAQRQSEVLAESAAASGGSRLSNLGKEVLLVGDDRGYVHKIEFERSGWHIFVLDEEFSEESAKQCLLPEMGGGWGAAVDSEEPAESVRARRRRDTRRLQARKAARRRFDNSRKKQEDAAKDRNEDTEWDSEPEGVGIDDELLHDGGDSAMADILGLEAGGLGDAMPRSGAAHLQSGLATRRALALKESGETVDWARFKRLRQSANDSQKWSLGSGALSKEHRSGAAAGESLSRQSTAGAVDAAIALGG